MNLYDETKYIMNKYNVHPNKSLGQNFLVDEETLDIIAEEVNKNDTIIEIGPGIGTLTEKLLKKAKKVIVIELDTKMAEIIKDRFKLYDNIEIINEDVLKVDINKLADNAKIVANLPYYITTSIITKLLECNIEDITVLIQKEVAQRICAIPGSKNAGSITYLVNYYADAKIIKNVSKTCFVPSPKVESAVVKMKKLDKPRVNVKNEEVFFEIVRSNFSKRRKTIINSLSEIIEKERLKQILKEMKIDENVRGETLTLEQYAIIANKLEEKN